MEWGALLVISIPFFVYVGLSNGNLKFYRLQTLGVGETKMGVAQSISNKKNQVIAYVKGIRSIYPMNPKTQILNL